MYLEASKIRGMILDYCKGSVIDLGCGRDPITPDAIAVDDDPAPEVTHVLDISKPMLEFSDRQFDTVFSSHALEDMKYPSEVLIEWVRILKVGGYMILYVPHPELYKGVNLEHKCAGFYPEQIEHIMNQRGCQTIELSVHDEPNCYSVLYVGRRVDFHRG